MSISPSERLLLGALVLAAAGAGASAQTGASGAESRFATTRDLAAGGGGASESFLSEASVASVALGTESVSSSYRFEGSVAWASVDLSGVGPVPFGIADGRGTKDGGEPETLFGVGFAAPFSGATSVSLGGEPATGVNVTSDLTLDLLTAAGVSPSGNPLGVVPVTVANALGTNTTASGYAYTPALVAEEPLRVGRPFRLRTLGEPGQLQEVYYGFSIPGFGIPIPGIDGAFELLAFFKKAQPTVFSAPSADTVWQLAIPNSPGLIGLTLEFQGSALDSISPLSGSLTNRLVTVVGS